MNEPRTQVLEGENSSECRRSINLYTGFNLLCTPWVKNDPHIYIKGHNVFQFLSCSHHSLRLYQYFVFPRADKKIKYVGEILNLEKKKKLRQTRHSEIFTVLKSWIKVYPRWMYVVKVLLSRRRIFTHCVLSVNVPLSKVRVDFYPRGTGQKFYSDVGRRRERDFSTALEGEQRRLNCLLPR